MFLTWPQGLTKLQLGLILAVLTISCSVDKLGFQADQQASAFGFQGVQAIKVTPDGHYVLTWDFAGGTADVGSISYEIYMAKWSAVPDGATSNASSLASDNGSVVLGAKLVHMSDTDAPVSTGVLLDSVKGVRNYTLTDAVQANLTYAFQVRAVNSSGVQDGNDLVLVYSPAENKLSFAGVSGLTRTGDGKLLLSWKAANSGTNASDVTYDVYMGITQLPVETVKAGAVAIQSLSLADSTPAVGSAVQLPADKLPSQSGSAIAQLKGTTLFQVDQDLSANLTYLFQVQAKGPNGELGDNASVIVYRPAKLQFAGLLQSGATLSPDGTKIILSWSPATGAEGTVTYVICDDANCAHPIFSTTATSYTFQNAAQGESYTFAVRAKDDVGPDTNTQFVVVPVPDSRDHTPPVFAGLASASTMSNSKILLNWQPSTASDIYQYNIYNASDLQHPVASTMSSSYIVGSLTPGLTYTFVVRAVDTSNNEDKNTVQRSASTLSYTVPEFTGLATVAPVGGVSGLTQLKLTWPVAGGSVTGYRIYMASAPGQEDFTTPVVTAGATTNNTAVGAYLAGQAATSAVVTGLSSNTTYYFVVRAFNLDGGGNLFTEVNTVERSAATNTIKAPTFAGLASAVAGNGSLGLTTANLTWTDPGTDGVYDGFVVAYEPGTCATAFSATPQTLAVTDATARSVTVTGLTPQTNYRFRIRTNYSVTNTADANMVCKDTNTTPPAPVFSGVASVATAAGTQGFNSLNVVWPQAQGSFSNYLIEWSTSSTFATVGGSSSISLISTTTTTLTSLPSKTTVYVRVSAVFSGSGVTLTSGAAKILNGTTTPLAPTGEGVSDVHVATATELDVTWTAPTNAGSGAVFSGYKFWKSCGASAPSDILTKMAGAADQTLPANQTSFNDAGLASNTQCCYQVRAYYDDGSYSLASASTTPALCATPALVAPAFAGLASVTNANDAAGFGQLSLAWTPVSAADAGNFTCYQVSVASTSTATNWPADCTSVAAALKSRTTATYTVTGLTENTTYYFRVRAVNANGSPVVTNGDNAFFSGKTTPKAPTGDALTNMAASSSTRVALTYTPPSAVASTGGLYNNIFLFIYQGTAANVASYHAGIGTIATATIKGPINQGTITLAAAPTTGALIQVPFAEITPGSTNTYLIDGLTTNQQVCVQALAVYWVNGQPTRYLESQTPTTKCATPVAGAPQFAGVTQLVGAGDFHDFTQIQAQWGAVTGDCTGIDISVQTSAGTPDFVNTSYKDLSCSATSQTLAGLTPHRTYYIQVRAKNVVSGNTYAAGDGVELSRVTRPGVPTGDGITAAAFTSMPKSIDKADLTFTLPTSGYWNKISIWKSTGVGLAAAEAAVKAAAATKSDNSGPTTAPLTQIVKASPTPTTYSDTNVTDGVSTCYLVRGVYDDGTYYYASANQVVQCGQTSYQAPVFSGLIPVSGASVVTASPWSDGTAKIQLTFSSPPAGDIEEYWVYFTNVWDSGTFDFSHPWQIVDNTAANIYNPTPGTATIYVGGQGRTFSGQSLFLVRYKHYGSTDVDTNTAIAGTTVPTAKANYVYVSPAMSGLAYGYYIGAYEASISAGSFGSNSISQSEQSLTTCSYQFHVNGVPFDSSCGTKGTTAVATSVPGVTPQASATWDNAFVSCRNASAGGTLVRLPTEEEWRRASHWDSSNYATMWSTYTTGCATASNASATGAFPGCVSNIGAYDMVGNLREWVDQRMTMYDISANSEARFSYGPQIGRILANGIDTQASGSNTPITRRYHNITPGANNLALLLGSDSNMAGITYKKQYDAETETWQDPTATASAAVAQRGFRCVAFPSIKLTPSMAALAQVREPVYTASDLPAGHPELWTIPENFYVKDVKPETVSMTGTFPGTAALSAWNFNNTSTSTTTVADLVPGGRPLTKVASVALATGIDGNSYANSPTGGGGWTSTDSFFDQTGTFTIGFWMYAPDWTALPVNGRIAGRTSSSGGTCSAGATCGYIVGTGSNYIVFGTYANTAGGAATGVSYTTTSLTAGWHHFVISRLSASSHIMYVDGSLGATGASTANIISATSGTAISFMLLAGYNIGPTFFHAGVAYNAAQAAAVYNKGMFNSSMLNDQGVKISWAPWTKTVCNPTCSNSSDTNFTYAIYRYIEPTKVDIRTTERWAIQHGPYSTMPWNVTGANATGLPLDPLARASDGSPICTATTTSCRAIAAVTGAVCNSSTPTGCTFTDSTSASSGFDPKLIYNYIMVVNDGLNNYQVPKVQRYRSPYFAGDRSLNASATFRTEPRFRRASVFLVDESYQQSATLQANPQIMVHVPMDQSGLDHDFFIQKYEAAAYSGTATNNSPTGSSAWPLAADSSGVWASTAGGCQDQFLRAATFGGSTGPCGSGTAINGTTAVLQSKQGTAPFVSVDQGGFWKACRNTGLVDGSGNVYYEYLPTGSEWFKAADWGDTSQSGYARVGWLATNFPTLASGTTITTLENGTGANGYCNSNSSAATAAAVTGTQYCRSRYNAADMVGNVWEWTTDQSYPQAGGGNSGYDDGIDGLWLSRYFWGASSSIAGVLTYDLLRGIPVGNNGASVIADNSDTYIYVSSLAGATRGGSFNSGTSNGRWTLSGNAPTTASSSFGGRCAR